jgi:membrane protein DedA with SNARE-associated domain
VGQLTEWIETLVMAWVGTLESSGYWGIFVLMTIESSLIPFPSEIVMLPAGVLAHQGKMNVFAAIFAGTAGSLAGALINYTLAIAVGRTFLERYGRYFFVPLEQLQRAEKVWEKHGELATFVCRLLPAIRQLISIPAGLARMNLFRFCLWTSVGAGLWVSILTFTGYWLGDKALQLWDQYKTTITIGLLALAVVLGLVFVMSKLLWKKAPASTPAQDLPIA